MMSEDNIMVNSAVKRLKIALISNFPLQAQKTMKQSP